MNKKPEAPFLDKVWREIHINFGTTLAPFHSFLTLTGLDTLALRMERHMSNAQRLAEFLAGHSKVSWVNYPGLASNPSHEVAKRQFDGKGYGALLTFGLAGYAKEARYIEKGITSYREVAFGKEFNFLNIQSFAVEIGFEEIHARWYDQEEEDGDLQERRFTRTKFSGGVHFQF